jgi:CheY-like chemotaxis protein
VPGIYPRVILRVNFGRAVQLVAPRLQSGGRHRKFGAARKRSCSDTTSRSANPGFQVPMPTVLLVDDERDIRSALRKIFERGGLSVREAESGRDALDAVAEDPAIAAVVSDFIMPELDGLDFYDALVSRAPYLRNRVVFLTGAARDPSVYQPLEDRGVPLINKLEDLKIVLDAVRLVLLRAE